MHIRLGSWDEANRSINQASEVISRLQQLLLAALLGSRGHDVLASLNQVVATLPGTNRKEQ